MSAVHLGEDSLIATEVVRPKKGAVTRTRVRRLEAASAWVSWQADFWDFRGIAIAESPGRELSILGVEQGRLQILRLDPETGAKLWQRKIGDAFYPKEGARFWMEGFEDGSVRVVGIQARLGCLGPGQYGCSQVFVARVGPEEGDVVFQLIEGLQHVFLDRVEMERDGEVLLAGTGRKPGSARAPFVAKIAANGGLSWSYWPEVTGPGLKWLKLVSDPGRNSVWACANTRLDQNEAVAHALRVRRTSGDELWRRPLGAGPESITELVDCSFANQPVLIGHVRSSASWTAFVEEISPHDGERRWIRQLGGSRGAVAHVDATGVIHLAGQSYLGGPGGVAPFLASIGPSGALLSLQKIGFGTSSVSHFTGAALGDMGRILFQGTTNGNARDSYGARGAQDGFILEFDPGAQKVTRLSQFGGGKGYQLHLLHSQVSAYGVFLSAGRIFDGPLDGVSDPVLVFIGK